MLQSTPKFAIRIIKVFLKLFNQIEDVRKVTANDDGINITQLDFTLNNLLSFSQPFQKCRPGRKNNEELKRTIYVMKLFTFERCTFALIVVNRASPYILD